jgi:hypothetical protein
MNDRGFSRSAMSASPSVPPVQPAGPGVVRLHAERHAGLAARADSMTADTNAEPAPRPSLKKSYRTLLACEAATKLHRHGDLEEAKALLDELRG